MENEKRAKERSERAHFIKNELEKGRRLVKSVLLGEKRKEVEQVRQINQALLMKIRKTSEELRNEKQKKSKMIKEQEQLLPFKLRFLEIKKHERIKEILAKKAEEQEDFIKQKEEELQKMAAIERNLEGQLKLIAHKNKRQESTRTQSSYIGIKGHTPLKDSINEHGLSFDNI